MPIRLHKKYTVFSLVLTGAAGLALLLPGISIFKLVLAAIYVLGTSLLYGKKLFPREHLLWRIFLGLFIVMSLLMTIGGIVYYFFDLAPLTSAGILLALPLAHDFLPKKKKLAKDFIGNRDFAHDNDKHFALPLPSAVKKILGLTTFALYSAMLVYGFYILQAAATDATIRSPWDVVPRLFFFVVFLAVSGLFMSTYSGLIARSSLIPTWGLMLLGVSVAALVYRTGFGFDPFIHQATEALIYSEGAVSPKPFYYLGQYAFVTLMTRLSGIGTVTFDTFFAPVLASMLVPLIYWSLRKAYSWSVTIAASTTFLIIAFPLSSFIVTTPQSIANILVIITSIMVMVTMHRPDISPLVSLLLAAATAITHPLAGIPLLFFVLVALVFRVSMQTPRLMSRILLAIAILLTLAGSIALPAVFVLNSKVSTAPVQISTEGLDSGVAIINELRVMPSIATRQFEATYDLVYGWHTSRTAILLLLAILAIVALRRHRELAVTYIFGLIIFGTNFVLLKTVIHFPFLIEYEQANYADRLAELTLLLMTPMVLYAGGVALKRIRRDVPSMKIGVTILIAFLITSSIYLAYPRRDKYESSRGWSTSASDIGAVKLINEDAEGEPYVVLANQSVSAAAIREFGFRTYFDSTDEEHPEEIFFYPVPTGGSLYDVFLEMNEGGGTEDIALKAMDLAGVDTVYYAVNHYWWKAQSITVSARREANNFWNVEDKVYIFKYTR